MAVGIGLGFIPILGVFLNLIRIQLFWPIFLGLSMIIPSYSLFIFIRNGGKIEFKEKLRIRKSTLYILCALFLTIILFVVFYKGAFTYPYLEDDDPWFHAMNTKYVANMKTFTKYDSAIWSYREPYPQGFIIITGLLHQTNDNVIWTLKFFNALIIALGILFFYFFALEFLGSKKKALFATFGLAVIPCFLSHFIWASSLAVTLFFPALYALEKTRKEKPFVGWMVVSALVIASLLVTQPSNSFIFGVFFFFYWIFSAASARRFLWRLILPGIIALVLAVLLFWTPMLMKYGLIDTAAASTINLKGGIGSGLQSINTLGSGGAEIYSFTDFMVAKKVSKMDNPIGIGVFLFWLAIFSFLIVIYSLLRRPGKLFSPENRWKVICVIWGIIAVLGINGNRLPFPMLMPHRWWAVLAIPLVLLCAEGFFMLGSIAKRFKIPKTLVYFVIIAGILATSGYPKYVVETSYWPPGVNWGSMEEVQGYLSFVAPLPLNTKVFPLCSDEFKVLAFDKLAEPWDPTYNEFKKDAFNVSAKKLNSWLNSRGYEYLTIDSYCIRKHDMNATNDKLAELGNSTHFRYVNGNKGLFLFRVL
jgi:hypothetical protein